MRTILPPQGKQWTRTSVTLPNDVWADLDRQLEVENATRSPPERLTRDKFMAFFLAWAIEEYDAERGKKPKK